MVQIRADVDSGRWIDVIVHNKTQTRFLLHLLLILPLQCWTVALIGPKQLERMPPIRLPLETTVPAQSIASARKRPEAELPLQLLVLFTSAPPDYSTFHWICCESVIISLSNRIHSAADFFFFLPWLMMRVFRWLNTSASASSGNSSARYSGRLVPFNCKSTAKC